jgi:uncharacterized small protein (DUF1192 family)
VSDYIGSSVQEIDAPADARLTGDLLDKLKDIDSTRIARDDQIVIRKAVLGLLAVVSELEGRIAVLERQLDR